MQDMRASTLSDADALELANPNSAVIRELMQVMRDSTLSHSDSGMPYSDSAAIRELEPDTSIAMCSIPPAGGSLGTMNV